jgi:tetratricopeptide (TPR) repeat protein
MPSFSDLKEIYLLRKYLFTIRLFPLFISSLFIFFVVSTYGIIDKYFIYSICCMLISLVFSIIWIRLPQKLTYAKELNLKGEFLQEYHLLNNLQNETLWESEKFKVDLNMAKLFYDVGNYKRFFLLMDEISTKSSNYTKEVFFYGLLKSFYFEIKNDFDNARIELEKICENTKDNITKLQSYNNIGRLEMLQGNFTSAQIFYEKSFEILESEQKPDFYPIVIHNLLIIYGKNNEKDKANDLINKYWNLIDKNKAKELLNYSNDLISYARQINDKALIEKTYNIIDEKVYKIANDSEKFILDISKLRMSYNDKINFDKHYEKIFKKIKLEKETLSLEEKLLVIGELKHVLTQYINEKKNIDSVICDLQWLTQWHLSLEEDILNKLTSIESSLSNVRIFWLSKLIDLDKTRIMFDESKDYLKNLTKMIKNIEESISIYKSSKNNKQEIWEILHFLDEIYSLYIQTKDQRIIVLYKDKMLKNLSEAETLLEKNWKQIGAEDYMIALAWFSWQLKQDTELTQKWLKRFDALNHSLNHYAEYIKNWYFWTNNWLNSQKI